MQSPHREVRTRHMKTKYNRKTKFRRFFDVTLLCATLEKLHLKLAGRPLLALWTVRTVLLAEQLVVGVFATADVAKRPQCPTDLGLHIPWKLISASMGITSFRSPSTQTEPTDPMLCWHLGVVRRIMWQHPAKWPKLEITESLQQARSVENILSIVIFVSP